MKKSLILISLLILSSTVLVAGNTKEWFIGSEFGGMHVRETLSSTIADKGGYGELPQHSYKSTYKAIKFGRYYETGRLYGFFAHQNKERKNIFGTVNIFGVGYDYLFKSFEKIIPKIIPFVGIQAMYAKAKLDLIPTKLLKVCKKRTKRATHDGAYPVTLCLSPRFYIRLRIS